MKYRPEIDGLRAVAVIPVILFHAGFNWAEGGYVGVDVFFVISGYLITNLIISDLESGSFSLSNFYERRARRILPALFLVMVASLPIAWLLLAPTDLTEFSQSLIAVATFFSNIFFWQQQSGYFATAGELKSLLHTWSLAVEEQFYIVFPLFLLITWRLGVRLVAAILIGAFLLSLFISVQMTEKLPNAAFFLLPSRGWELLLGAGAAFLLKYRPPFTSLAIHQFLSLTGLGLLTFSLLTFDQQTRFPGPLALVPTFGTFLLIVSTVPNTTLYSALGYKPLVSIGLISYSAYLWHQPLFSFARHRVAEELPIGLASGLCFLTLVLAWCTWRLVELPFRDARKVSINVITRGAIIGVVFFICAGGYGLITKGGLNNLSDEERTLYSNFIDARQYVTNRGDAMQGSDFKKDTDKRRVLIIGDSFAEDLVNAVHEAGLDNDYSFGFFKIPARCGIVFSTDTSRLAHRSRDCRSRSSLDNPSLRPILEKADEVWLSSIWPHTVIPYLEETIQSIMREDKKVIIFGAKYFGEVSANHFKRTRASMWDNQERTPLELQKATRLQEKNAYIRDRALSAGVSFINPHQVICGRESHCQNFLDYRLISFDGEHLTRFGASRFGENLKAYLNAL